MKEAVHILRGFGTLCDEQKRAALATVVRVSGSSYRRPGARMLVAVDGRTWGGVSGGCLERDVARLARNAIESGRPEIQRYDTSDDFDAGATLGCAGLIDIFIEPVSADQPGPFPAIGRAIRERIAVAMGTVLRSASSRYTPGGRISLEEHDHLFQDALIEVAQSGISGIHTADGVEIFVEYLKPPQSLVLFGGGPDVVPVVEIAKSVGWHVTVISSHAITGFRERFSAADCLAAGTDIDPLGGVAIEPGAAVVLITHNYPRDLAVLPMLLERPLNYIGLLGPRRRAERLVLESPGIPPDAIQRLHAPVGIDIGANTPEMIALAIVTEIQAVLSNRACISLRNRQGPIYSGDEESSKSPYNPVSCPLSA